MSAVTPPLTPPVKKADTTVPISSPEAAAVLPMPRIAFRICPGEAASYCIEKRYVRKDGGIIWASLTVGCVRKTDGVVDYFWSSA